MSKKRINKMLEQLEKNGSTPEQLTSFQKAYYDNMPEEVYIKAVNFLGYVTGVLVLGAVLLLGFNITVNEALWGAIGAGIGGLAGVVTAK